MEVRCYGRPWARIDSHMDDPRPELSSVSTALDELTKRLSTMADAVVGAGRDGVAEGVADAYGERGDHQIVGGVGVELILGESQCGYRIGGEPAGVGGRDDAVRVQFPGQCLLRFLD